jgi:hypothetical protein
MNGGGLVIRQSTVMDMSVDDDPDLMNVFLSECAVAPTCNCHQLIFVQKFLNNLPKCGYFLP